jgi:hypothetical protein
MTKKHKVMGKGSHNTLTLYIPTELEADVMHCNSITITGDVNITKPLIRDGKRVYFRLPKTTRFKVGNEFSLIKNGDAYEIKNLSRPDNTVLIGKIKAKQVLFDKTDGGQLGFIDSSMVVSDGWFPASYLKQTDDIKDWTLTLLKDNKYTRFNLGDL